MQAAKGTDFGGDREIVLDEISFLAGRRFKVFCSKGFSEKAARVSMLFGREKNGAFY